MHFGKLDLAVQRSQIDGIRRFRNFDMLIQNFPDVPRRRQRL